MGGNPGALGNGLSQSRQWPPTEYVDDMRAVEQALIFSEIDGKRNWYEVLTMAFRDEYPDADELYLVVGKCLDRIQKQFVPIKIMNVVREQERFNTYAACK